MFISKYKYSDPGPNGWDFSEVSINRVNLFVGNSAAGKSRLLNTITSLGETALTAKITKTGNWVIEFSEEGKKYVWHIKTENTDESPIVEYEKLCELETESGREIKTIVDRQDDRFTYNGQELPKMKRDICSVSLLKENEDIAIINNGFTKILRRNFYNEELSHEFSIVSDAIDAEEKYKKKDLCEIVKGGYGVNTRIALLKQKNPPKYEIFKNTLQEIFPFITDIQVSPGSKTNLGINLPFNSVVICLKEKNIANLIPIRDISTGMQKIILLLIDILTMPENSVILIDEYENSLGLNAINFIPHFLYSVSNAHQFIMTSHHPYIINNINIEDWHIFNRNGYHVAIKSGKEFKEKFGKSRQQQFIKLLNEPFYIQGVK